MYVHPDLHVVWGYSAKGKRFWVERKSDGKRLTLAYRRHTLATNSLKRLSLQRKLQDAHMVIAQPCNR